jgi:hypothetical protein
VTQEQAAKHFELKPSARGTIGLWETSQEVPPEYHRARMLTYIRELLKVRTIEELGEIWSEIVEIWEWEDLKATEKNEYFSAVGRESETFRKPERHNDYPYKLISLDRLDWREGWREGGKTGNILDTNSFPYIVITAAPTSFPYPLNPAGSGHPGWIERIQFSTVLTPHCMTCSCLPHQDANEGESGTSTHRPNMHTTSFSHGVVMRNSITHQHDSCQRQLSASS